MKLFGKKLESTNVVTKVFPRGGEGMDLVIRARAIYDYTQFEESVPTPEPYVIQKSDGSTEKDFEDPKYRDELEEWFLKKSYWMALKSLQATEGLEWESVDMSDSDTWGNYLDELKVVFTPQEIDLVAEMIMDACGLNRAKIEEATESFLVGMGPKPLGHTSPNSEPSNTPASEPVSASE